MQDTPMIQMSFRLFRVKPGSWFAPREPGDPITPSIASTHIDENGNVEYRYLEMASSLLAIQEYDKGNLVDVTDKPTRPIFADDSIGKQPTPESEAIQFVEDDIEVVEMPPIENYKPRRKRAKKKTGGNKP